MKPRVYRIVIGAVSLLALLQAAGAGRKWS
jgi:hypothetical protein